MPPRPAEPSQRPPGLGPLVVLSTTLAVGGFMALIAVAYLVAHPPAQQIPLGLPQASHLEAGLYLAGFLLALPAGLVVGRRQAEAVAAGPNGQFLTALVAVLAGALAAAVLVARLVPQAGLLSTLASAGLWCAGTTAGLVRARRAPEWRLLAKIAAHETTVVAASGALTIAALLAFTSPGSISPGAFGITAAAAIGVVILYLRREGHLTRRLPKGARIAVDVLAVLLLLLAVPDLVVFGPPGVGGPPGVSSAQLAKLSVPVITFHHDLFLGPVNQLLAGDGVLVKTASQYGVAPLYLLAGWFKLAPIGYGTFGFFDGVLTGLFYATAYGVLRLLRTPRILAWAAMAVAVVVLAYNHPWSIGVFPQQGPLRFGLPMLLLLSAATEARWPRGARFARASRFAVIGLASIWSLESFVYCIATLGGLLCFEAFTDDEKGARWLRRQAGLSVGACFATHVAFAGATLAAFGHLPNWKLYGDLVECFLFGGMSKITFDIPAWSPVVAIGAGYALSVAALAFTMRRRPAVLDAEWCVLRVIAATTVYGIVILYYYVDRSLNSVLPYISLPLLMVGTLWLGLILRSRSIALRVRASSLAFALGLAVLLVATAWSSAGARFQRSALGHLVPGGATLSAAMTALWHPHPASPRAPAAERLLDAYMPGAKRVYLLLPPDLATEALMSSGRANAFPFSDPWEETFVASERYASLRDAVDRMRVGDRVLIWAPSLTIPPGSPEAAIANVIDTPIEAGFSQNSLVPIQVAALQLIRQRFALQVLPHGAGGMEVVQLEPAS